MAPGNEGIEIPILTGAQAVPLVDSYWDQNDGKDECMRYHFIHLIMEGLKRARLSL
jgi:hypothetical protein